MQKEKTEQAITDVLIRQQAAIKAVKRLSLGETDALRLALRIEDYLERLPSAQPEPAIPISWIRGQKEMQ